LHDLLRLGNTDSILLKVVDGIPLPQERITEDSERASGLWDVHPHQGGDAGTLDLEDVVKRTDGEVVAGEGEGQVWEAVALIALNGVLAVV
jgi:hypothetical protein